MTSSMDRAYYDAEAGGYDDSRGGTDRAVVAARAVTALVGTPGRCVDVAGGTGIVSAELARQGWAVLVLDASPGMLQEATQRLPGRAVQGDAARLPLADGAVELVTIIWMLNLVPVDLADTVLREAARVLAPGGSLVISVDKERAHDAATPVISDADDRVTALLAPLGLDRSGSTTFTSPSPWGSATAADPVFRLTAFRRRGGL